MRLTIITLIISFFCISCDGFIFGAKHSKQRVSSNDTAIDSKADLLSSSWRSAKPESDKDTKVHFIFTFFDDYYVMQIEPDIHDVFELENYKLESGKYSFPATKIFLEDTRYPEGFPVVGENIEIEYEIFEDTLGLNSEFGGQELLRIPRSKLAEDYNKKKSSDEPQNARYLGVL